MDPTCAAGGPWCCQAVLAGVRGVTIFPEANVRRKAILQKKIGQQLVNGVLAWHTLGKGPGPSPMPPLSSYRSSRESGWAGEDKRGRVAPVEKHRAEGCYTQHGKSGNEGVRVRVLGSTPSSASRQMLPPHPRPPPPSANHFSPGASARF